MLCRFEPSHSKRMPIHVRSVGVIRRMFQKVFAGGDLPIRTRQSTRARKCLVGPGLILLLASMTVSVLFYSECGSVKRRMTATGPKVLAADIYHDVSITTGPTTALNRPPAIQKDWMNRNDLVHVIQTRFMQNQPNLLHLAEARLQLFETFTLPSIARQSLAHEFLWIIRVDPDLHSSIMTKLLKLLEKESTTVDVVVLKSNDNPEGFRHVRFEDPSTLEFGSWDLLHSYQRQSHSKLLLETRLDADDALALNFIELLQQDAKSMKGSSLRVFCVDSHLEWQHYSYWEQSKDSGSLVGLRTGYCVTPGLTFAYPVGVDRSSLEISTKHHKLHQQLIPCDVEKGENGPCLQRLGVNSWLALRSRTITSAGMGNLILRSQVKDHTSGEASTVTMNTGGHTVQSLYTHDSWRRIQGQLWGSLTDWFGVQPTKIVSMRGSIEADLHDVLQDAIEGQCKPGHSCKKSSREVLERLRGAIER